MRLSVLYTVLIILAIHQFGLPLLSHLSPDSPISYITPDPIVSEKHEKSHKPRNNTIATNHTNPATTMLPVNNTAMAIASMSKNTSNKSISSEAHLECKCVHCMEDKLCGGLWHAKGFPPVGSEDPHNKKIHIVVSYCRSNLEWISSTFTQSFNVDSIHVISKCGQNVTSSPENATILELPNVGRCDHSYAYYIANLLSKHIVKGEEKDSVVIFLKDDMSAGNLHQQGHWSNLERMVNEASSTNGFSCGVVPPKSLSTYHKRSALFDFEMESYDRKKELSEGNGESFKSIYKNLGDFHESVIASGGDSNTNISYPELVQVCYGGVFAASYSNINKVDHSTWKRIEKALSRGDNIEEGHFVERSWASILATSLQPYQVEAMNNYTNRHFYFSLQPKGYGSAYQPGLLLSPSFPSNE